MKKIIFIDFLKQIIMEGILVYSQYILKIGVKMKAIMSTPSTAIAGASVVGLTLLTSVQLGIWLLVVFSTFDFLTGVGASWVVKKKAEKLDPELKEKNLISSDKLKLSLVKNFVYFSFILMVHLVEVTFKIKTYKMDFLSEEAMSITLIAIGICCGIEVYSIVFENFKTMGFDLAAKITQTTKAIKKLYSEVKE